MKLKMMFFVLLVAAIALNALPAYATDFSGYVESTNYTWSFVKDRQVSIEGGAARRWIRHYYLNNLEAFPLTEAIIVGKITELWYWDDGVVKYTSDPAKIAQYVRFANSRAHASIRMQASLTSDAAFVMNWSSVVM